MKIISASVTTLIMGMLVAAGVSAIGAQGRPKATIELLQAADGVHPGEVARVALRVSLPDGVHMQSNAPRDPLLIATAVTAAPPAGLSVQEVVYPLAKDFQQAGQPVPLAVFDQQTVIGVAVATSAGATPGDLSLPLRLRYQACDASTCYAPLREELVATIHVVPADARVTRQHDEVFRALQFRP